ncbi:MAG: GNAT family N-acetyltransferase [Caldilineaceae bacterium]|nr:GNAT family N-acetyltransferase [Caldilineaceae bacterium]
MPDRWAEFLADPRHHLAVALADDEVIGMASALHYVHPDKPPELWINEVSVTPAWQQQGVATTLLTALFAQARALGCTAAWVLTEIDNYAARRLYASAGGEEEEPRPALSVFDLGL